MAEMMSDLGLQAVVDGIENSLLVEGLHQRIVVNRIKR